MKTSTLTIILILTLCFTTKANQDCIWTSSKSGLTIHLVAPCDFKNQTLIDSIVNRAVSLINREDTSLKILVFVSHGQLSFPNAEYSNFFSIGYDTLRQIDNEFIFNYYWNQDGISSKQNGGLNTFKSQQVPLDINSTNGNTLNETGIKIIYDKDYRLGEPDWADITKAIVYATKNVDTIKKHQRRDTVRYNTNGWYVSLVTLDTFSINKMLGRVPDNSETRTKDVAATNNTYFIIGGMGLLLLLGLFLVRQKHIR